MPRASMSSGWSLLVVDLRCEGLVHVYRDGGVRALDGVDLQVRAGERVALIGQNGSGKTTLVRHLNGLLRPTEGSVLVDGADAGTLTVAQLAARVGLVFQDPDRQIFASSVQAEVEFGPRNLGRSGPELRSAVADALRATGLEADTSTNPYDLGQSRRKLLALASVLAMSTPVIVLDEPTTGQDARGVERVRRVIDAAAAAGRTVIAISHDMRFVAEAFERVVVMRSGSVILDGTPAEVFADASSAALESTYLEPPLAARLGHRLGTGPDADGRQPDRSAGRRSVEAGWGRQRAAFGVDPIGLGEIVAMLALALRSRDRERHDRRRHLVQTVSDAAEPQPAECGGKSIGKVLAAQEREHER